MLKLLLCLKYLSRRKVVLLSVFAVALSCALLISVASLFGGFINAIEQAAVDNMGDVIVGPLDSGIKIIHSDILREKLEKLDCVEATTPILSTHGLLLLGKGNVKRVSVWGIDPESQKHVTKFEDTLFFDEDFTPESDDYSTGYIGIGLAIDPDLETDEYDLSKAESLIGKKVVLIAGTAKQSSSSSAVPDFKRKSIPFKVSNLVFSGVHQFDSQFVYLPIEEVVEKLYPEVDPSLNLAEAVQVRLKEGADLHQSISQINACWEEFALNTLGWNSSFLSNFKPQASVELQRRLIEEYRKQMGMLLVIFGIVSLGIIFLISCIFYMIILTRKKDIAIIKSFGGGKSTIVTIFLSFGFSVGIVGALLGYVFGYIFTKNVNSIEHGISVVFGLKIWKSSTYMFDKIPDQIDVNAAMWICGISVVAAVVGSAIPALVAAKVNPVKILRYE